MSMYTHMCRSLLRRRRRTGAPPGRRKPPSPPFFFPAAFVFGARVACCSFRWSFSLDSGSPP